MLSTIHAACTSCRGLQNTLAIHDMVHCCRTKQSSTVSDTSRHMRVPDLGKRASVACMTDTRAGRSRAAGCIDGTRACSAASAGHVQVAALAACRACEADCSSAGTDGTSAKAVGLGRVLRGAWAVLFWSEPCPWDGDGRATAGAWPVEGGTIQYIATECDSPLGRICQACHITVVMHRPLHT